MLKGGVERRRGPFVGEEWLYSDEIFAARAHGSGLPNQPEPA